MMNASFPLPGLMPMPGDDEELEEETGSEVLGESVSELDEALSDAVSEPDAAEDVE